MVSPWQWDALHQGCCLTQFTHETTATVTATHAKIHPLYHIGVLIWKEWSHWF